MSTPGKLIQILVLVTIAGVMELHAQGPQSPRQGCAADHFNRVELTGRPDFGTYPPNLVVAVNTTVQLQGVAEKVTIGINCNFLTTPLSFRWSLSYQAPGGRPIDISSRLQGLTTLNPTFVVQNEGTYVATLSAVGVDALLRIIASPPGGTWYSMGPTNVAGHLNAIVIDPVTKDMYVGAATGGVWKSVDHGASWYPLTDSALPTMQIRSLALTPATSGLDAANIFAGTDTGIFQSLDGGATWSAPNLSLCDNGFLQQASVNKIVLSPTNASVLYAATTSGVLRTIDSGNCWVWVSQSFANQNVWDLVVIPSSPAKVFAAAEATGIYRTTDADPTTWILLNGLSNSGLPPPGAATSGGGGMPLISDTVSVGDKRLFVSDTDLQVGVPPAGTLVGPGQPDVGKLLVRFGPMEYHSDPNRNGSFDSGDVIYQKLGLPLAGCGQWHLGVNIGDRRLNVPNAPTTVSMDDPDRGTCLVVFHPREKHTKVNSAPGYGPTDSVYRDARFQEIVLAGADANTVYAGFEPAPYEIFKSTDGGDTWHELPRAPQNCDNGQCSGWDNLIAIDPRRPNFVYVGQVHLWVTKDDGNSWQDLSGPNQNTNDLNDWMHDDQHAIAFDPDDPTILYAGNDGGIYRLLNDPEPFSSPRSFWLDLNHNLVTTQFFTLATNPESPGGLVGGLQDNGVMRNSSESDWNFLNGGDGGATGFDAGSSIGRQQAIYFTYSGGPDSAGIHRWPDNVTLGGSCDGSNCGNFFVDPYRPENLLRIDGQSGAPWLLSFRSTNASQINPVSVMWSCLGPASDTVTAAAFVRPFEIDSGDSQYYLGTQDGGVYFVSVPPGLQSQPTCSSFPPRGVLSARIYPVATPVADCPRPVGPVRSITIDPNNSELLYLTFDGLGTSDGGSGQVVRLALNGASCGQDITGLVGIPGFLPRGLKVVNLVADPFGTDFVYLATNGGLFEGILPSPGTPWRWSRAPGIPPIANVTSVKLHENVGGTSGRIYAATFGRGVFELVRARRILPILKKDDILNCVLMDPSDPVLKGRGGELHVSYAYYSAHGRDVSIRAVPLQKGKELPYFLQSKYPLRNGPGQVNLQVFYAANDAPLSTETDAIRLEFLNPSGSPFFFKIFKISKTWRRKGAALLSVRVESRGDETLWSTTIPVVVVTNGIKTTKIAPLDLIVQQGTTVSLQMPAQYGKREGVWVFAGWSVPENIQRKGSSIALTLNHDTTLRAYYESRKPQSIFALSLKAVCEVCKPGAELMSIPVRFATGAGYATGRQLQTPFETSLFRATKVTLTAPKQVRANDRDLEFVRWSPDTDHNANSPETTLMIRGDVIAVAIYAPKPSTGP